VRGKIWEAFESDEQPVLLIDEIDKADIEFPNDLLRELDRMEFYVYETKKLVEARHRPIIVITSNNEKELPGVPAALFLPLHQVPRPGNDDGNRRRAFSEPQERSPGGGAKGVLQGA
jgi:hypothetical protein